MRLHYLIVASLICISFGQLSCSRKKVPEIPNKVQLGQVVGNILVDGAPMGGVLLTYKPDGEVAETRPQYTRFFTMSNQDGSFALKTYIKNDGVPPGEWSLYCELFPKTRAEIAKMGDEDRFDGNYFPPKPPVKKFTVKAGEKNDLGTIELKTVVKKKK